MQTTLIRAIWLSLCVLIATDLSNAQELSRSAATDRIVENQQTPVQVVYTGSLFGYFRSPSKQSGRELQPCRHSATGDSQAAIDFLRNRERYQSGILVGTGDNFAPRREARAFDPPPENPDVTLY